MKRHYKTPTIECIRIAPLTMMAGSSNSLNDEGTELRFDGNFKEGDIDEAV